MMMLKRRTVKPTPRLRFPEFRNASEWTLGKASDIVDVLQGYGFPERLQGRKDGEFPFYKVSDISACVEAGGTLLADANNHVGLEAIEELRAKPMPIGTTVFAKIGEAIRSNKRAITMRPCLVDNNVAGVKAIAGLTNDRFVYYLWCQVPLIEHAGGVVPSISKSAIEQIPIHYPVPAEQERIADCLTSLDEVIAAQGRKVEALKTHKRGLMQQLFPREGETRPRLRFPEFRDAPDWETRPFGDFVVRSFYGTSNSTAKKGKYPVLRMGNMVDGSLRYSNLVFLDLDLESFEDIRLMPGDILLNRTNSLDLVGKISLFDDEIECITASYIVTYRLDKAKLEPSFCNAMLNSPRFQSKIKALARPSVSQANINPTTFRNELSVSVPAPIEQQRISDCLTSLNTQIAAESDQLAMFETHKQGLMQQLFPAPESDGA